MLKDSQVMATIPCRNLENSRRFYEGVLGLEPYQADIPGAVAYELRKGSFIYLYETAAGGGEATRLGFVSDDFDSEVRRLRDNGVSFEDYDLPEIQEGSSDTPALTKTEPGIFLDPVQGKNCWFKDPDGNILSLGEEKGLVKRAAA